MLKIELSNLHFYSYHGVYDHEQKTGGDFEVNLVVYFQPAKIPVLHLSETIDYTNLYKLIKRRMENPTRLIETLATQIAQEILDSFLLVDEVCVGITKLNPPIPSFKGSVAASFTLKRKK